MVKKILVFILVLAIRLLPQGYICAVGGGTENYNDWSDKPYGWIVEKADSGTIIVLSYSSQSSWIPDYFESLGAEHAYNKKISTRSVADLQSTYDEIIAADGIFIKGGDQWEYISNWKGTKTEDAIREVYQRGGVVSGTSAGAMVLSDVNFSAQYGSVYPRQALKNPYINALALEDDFLDLFPNTLFDTHYIERGRFGRLIPFFLKTYAELDKSIFAVGIDDRTALCIDSLGVGTVYGSAAVSIFQIDEQTRIEATNEYVIENLRCDMLVADWKYDFVNKEVIPSDDAYYYDPGYDLQYLKTNMMLTGINSPSRNAAVSLTAFLETYSVDTIAVFYTVGNETEANSMRDECIERDAVAYTIPISEESLNNQDIADTVAFCDAIMFVGEDVEEYKILVQNNSKIGYVYQQKVETKTPLYMLGNSSKLTGYFYIGDDDTYELAAYRGLMRIYKGLDVFNYLEVQPLIFDDSDYYENRSASVPWGMVQLRKRFGLYIDSNDYVTIDKNRKELEAFGSMPLIFLDANNVTYVDSSTWTASGYNSTRQAVGMANLRYTVSMGNKRYNFETGTLVDINEATDEIPQHYVLDNNYPNPFNGSTVIPFSLPQYVDSGTITIYSLLGERVHLFDISGYQAGNHTVLFKAEKLLPSGIYFYTIRTNSFFDTKKMMYLK